MKANNIIYIAFIIFSICTLGICQQIKPIKYKRPLVSDPNRPVSAFSVSLKNQNITAVYYPDKVRLVIRQKGNSSDIKEGLSPEKDEQNKRWVFILNKGSLSPRDWDGIPDDYDVIVKTRGGTFTGKGTSSAYIAIMSDESVSILITNEECSFTTISGDEFKLHRGLNVKTVESKLLKEFCFNAEETGNQMIFNVKSAPAVQTDDVPFRKDDENKQWVYSLHKDKLSMDDWRSIPQNYLIVIKTQYGNFSTTKTSHLVVKPGSLIIVLTIGDGTFTLPTGESIKIFRSQEVCEYYLPESNTWIREDVRDYKSPKREEKKEPGQS